MENTNHEIMPFDLPKNRSSVIKAIGVGGGGSNAVNHMFLSGINGVDFIICNTDAQALENSPIPNKIQLGVSLTEGLGAGANPSVGEEAAKESIEEITKVLETNTKMVFITAGMGGGTGTGAAPVIAKVARDLGILTVGIVTSPFAFEGKNRLEQAEKGIEGLRAVVDSLVVINNNKLREVYGNLGFKAGFAKADEVLSTAARGIAEVITHHYTTNIDLRDAKTVLANSGTAIMGAATAMGENRAKEAISAALDSPLLNDNHIKGAKNVLLLIVSGNNEITIDEIGEVNDFIQAEAGGDANIIMGIGDDESLGDEISITVIATGFNADQQTAAIGKAPAKVVHTLEEDQPISTSVYNAPIKMDDEDSDLMLDQELNKALSREKEEERKQQTTLFEEDYDQPLYPAAEPVADGTKEEEIEEEPSTAQEEEADQPRFELKEEETPIDDHPMFQLNEDEIEAHMEVEENRESPVEIEAQQGEEEDAFDFNIFEIDAEEKANIEAEEESPIIDQNPEEPTHFSSEPSPEPVTKMDKPKEEAPRRVFRLEDIQELEEKLSKGISPTAQTNKQEELVEDKSETEVADEDLNFVVKTKTEAPISNVNNGRIDPMESSIEESMRLRQEERRAKLKAFNYRFKNNPHNLTEADNEPAYKRHGINIEQGSHSSRESQGRMTLNEGEDGPNFKSNNSFLHDNVD